MIDVVLNQAGQGAELGQVRSQNAQLVHLTQGGSRPELAAQDAHEDIPGLGGLSHAIVDQIQGRAHRPLRLLTQAKFLGLGDLKDAQQPNRIFAEVGRAGEQHDLPIYGADIPFQKKAAMTIAPPPRQPLER